MVTQLCPTLCNPMDCRPPGSSVHGILQVRILEWGAIPFSRGSSQPRDRTGVSCIAGRFFTTEPPGKPKVEPASCQLLAPHQWLTAPYHMKYVLFHLHVSYSLSDQPSLVAWDDPSDSTKRPLSQKPSSLQQTRQLGIPPVTPAFALSSTWSLCFDQLRNSIKWMRPANFSFMSLPKLILLA